MNSQTISNRDLCQQCGKLRFEHANHNLCEPDRNSDESLQQRLDNSNEMLAAALDLIGAMQPVVTAAETFMDSLYADATPLGKAVAEYREYKIKHRTSNLEHGESHHHLPSGRDSDHPLHGQTSPP